MNKNPQAEIAELKDTIKLLEKENFRLAMSQIKPESTQDASFLCRKIMELEQENAHLRRVIGYLGE